MQMELNAQQELAVKYDQGHVLVLAGAGTGKTRTIISRAAYLIEKGIPVKRILLLTFTRRAAREMKDRLHQMVGVRENELTAGTFHHFCLYSMRRMSKEFGVEKSTVIDRDDQVQLMKLIRADFRKKGEVFPKAAELVNLASYARNTVQPIGDYLDRHTEYEDDIRERIVRIARAYDERKKLSDYLDYDDILFRFAKVLHEVPAVRERLRGFFDHILVDEMQDTNPLQWLIIDGLRDPAKLFCVGDDAQSIYAFRGADFRNVHHFTERIPDAVVLRLEKNYRSTQGVLDLSNWLLKQSPLGYDKSLQAHRRTVSTPVLLDFGTDFEEARWIADDLVERHETGAPWKDHMIITRTAFGARAVESFMVERDIPYRFIGGVSLLHAAHVKDLLSLVRAASSHHDELSWARYLTLWPRIGDATAAKLIKGTRECANVKEAMAHLKGVLKGREEIIKGFLVVLENWTSPADAITAAGKFLTPLLKKRYERWDTRKKDFELLSRLAERHRSLMAFIETYTLDPISTTESERLEQDDLVTLSTAHSAKGTETRVCYLIRVEPGMYPHVRSIGRQDDEEEERRILYVAMTRAQDELIITRTLSGYGPLRMPYSASARHSAGGSPYFFEEVPTDLVDTDVGDFETSHLSDYDVINPWNR
jgi:ATP-dependent DNA helicase UvrD/PcrA